MSRRSGGAARPAAFQQEQARKERDLEHHMTQGEALFYQRQYEEAAASAHQALKLAEDLFGSGSVETLAPYILAGSAHLGNGSVNDADKNLTQAHWTALKLGDCPVRLRSQLHRALGRLYLAKEMPAEALTHLAEDVFYASTAYGPGSAQVAGGYFLMACLFESEDEKRCAKLFAKVAELWCDSLTELLETQGVGTFDSLGQALSSEAYQHCQALEEYFAERRQPEYGQQALAQVHLSRASIHALRSDFRQAKEHLGLALVAVETAQLPESETVHQQALTLTKILRQADGQ